MTACRSARRGRASYIIATPEPDDESKIDDFTPVVIAESTTKLKQLSVSDAARELDMAGAPVMVFSHAAYGSINIVCRCADGYFGWIDPAVSEPPEGH